MNRSEYEIIAAAKEYLSSQGAEVGADISELLGSGEDGIVWRTTLNTALKVFYRKQNFSRELACYLRLSRWNNITELAGFSVPHLIGEDEDLMAIEMGIVAPPVFLTLARHLYRPGAAKQPAIRQFLFAIPMHVH